MCLQNLTLQFVPISPRPDTNFCFYLSQNNPGPSSHLAPGHQDPLVPPDSPNYLKCIPGLPSTTLSPPRFYTITGGARSAKFRDPRPRPEPSGAYQHPLALGTAPLTPQALLRPIIPAASAPSRLADCPNPSPTLTGPTCTPTEGGCRLHSAPNAPAPAPPYLQDNSLPRSRLLPGFWDLGGSAPSGVILRTIVPFQQPSALYLMEKQTFSI